MTDIVEMFTGEMGKYIGKMEKCLGIDDEYYNVYIGDGINRLFDMLKDEIYKLELILAMAQSNLAINTTDPNAKHITEKCIYIATLTMMIADKARQL